MFLNRQWAVFRGSIWCLFALWLLFGGVELAEQAHVISEFAGEDQQASDQDEDALTQLASGLKSDVQVDISPHGLADTALPDLDLMARSEHGSQRPEPLVHGPPSLRLHQYLSVYRI